MCINKAINAAHVVIVVLLTLIIEAIYTVDRGALMVPTQQEEVFRIFHFIGQQETDGF